MRALTADSTSWVQHVPMLYADRRTPDRKPRLYDLGNTQTPTHDPAQRLQGWASTTDDVNRTGQAAMTQRPSNRVAARNVLPGMVANMKGVASPDARRPAATDFTPRITSPAEQRASMRPAGVGSRAAAWGSGSTPMSQTITPGSPMRTSNSRTQNVLPQVARGATFAQRARKLATTRFGRA